MQAILDKLIIGATILVL